MANNSRGKLKSHWNPDGDAGLTQVKAGSTLLCYAQMTTQNNSDCWLWLWDKLAANVTVNTTAPYAVLFIPAGDGSTAAGNVGEFNHPLELDTGLTYACSDSPDSVSNASGWSNCQVQLFYR